MGNASNEEINKALREYLEAIDSYRKLVDECVSVFGEETSRFTPKVLTRETLEELNEAHAKVNKARQKFMATVRRLPSYAKRQSS